MTRGAWETNMSEREITVTKSDEELLTSTARNGGQNGAAAEQQRTAVVAALVARTEAVKPVAVVGALYAAQVIEEEKWSCKVLSCTGDLHRLKDCPQFGKMDPRDRVALVERLKLCVDCLTPGHKQLQLA
jgi:hypothetical protein